MTDTSVPELYLAGFLPGFLLAVLFMLTVVLLCWMKPDWDGEPVNANWNDRLRALPALVPPIGILLMVLLETALITPPIGINLYVVQGVRGRGEMLDVMIGALPFVITMVAMIGLLTRFA